ncbi:hypothetical protein BTVI_47904 [Pitangus sulphuratus]|nr:hypothetical protein BTVI_47904 [Pitangus sulphuratus]
MTVAPGHYLRDPYDSRLFWALILNRFFLQITSSANVSLVATRESRVTSTAGDDIRLITLVEYINHGFEAAIVQVHVLLSLYTTSKGVSCNELILALEYEDALAFCAWDSSCWAPELVAVVQVRSHDDRVFSNLSDSMVLLFNVMKSRNIIVGKAMALERVTMFEMNSNMHLLEMRTLSCSMFGRHF